MLTCCPELTRYRSEVKQRLLERLENRRIYLKRKGSSKENAEKLRSHTFITDKKTDKPMPSTVSVKDTTLTVHNSNVSSKDVPKTTEKTKTGLANGYMNLAYLHVYKSM